MAYVSSDDLEPALRTTLQLLGELGISSPDASAQVQCLLEEFKDLVAKRDLELQRYEVGLLLHPPLSHFIPSSSPSTLPWRWNPTQLLRPHTPCCPRGQAISLQP